MTLNQNPEQQARDNIDALLTQAGWVVQSARKIDLNAGSGQVVREYQTDVGPADYVLFVGKKAVGVNWRIGWERVGILLMRDSTIEQSFNASKDSK